MENVFNWNLFGSHYRVILMLTRRSEGPAAGRLDLRAVSEEGEPFGAVSIIPHDGRKMAGACEHDHFFIKNYSENEGVMEQLIEQGFITNTGAEVTPRGSYVTFPMVKLTAKGRALAPDLFPLGGDIEVEINRSIPTVSVKCPHGETYFFQEHEAERVLKEAEAADVGNNGWSTEECIQHMAMNW